MIDITKIRTDIEGSSEDSRFSAWMTLYASDDPIAIQEINRIIEGQDPILKILLSRFLSHIQEKKAATYLIRLIQDSNYDVSHEAKFSFSRCPYSDKDDGLIPLIHASEKHIQSYAIEQLAMHRRFEIVGDLTQMLKTETEELQLHILRALRFLPSRGILPHIFSLRRSPKEEIRFRVLLAFDALFETYSLFSKRIFIEMLSDLSPRIRQTALWSLRKHPSKRLVSLVSHLTKTDPDPMIRKECIRYLELFPSQKTLKKLIDIVATETTVMVRLKAESAISNMPYHILKRGMSKYIFHKEENIRHIALLLFSTSKPKDPDFFRIVLQGLDKSKSEKEIVAYLESFGTLGNIQAIPNLENFLTHTSPIVSYTAAIALSKVYQSSHITNVINILKKTEIGIPTKQVILTFLRRKGNEADFSLELIHAVTPFLEHKNQTLRYLAVGALSHSQSVEIVRPLFSALLQEAHHPTEQAMHQEIATLLSKHPQKILDLLREYQSEKYAASLVLQLLERYLTDYRGEKTILLGVLNSPFHLFRTSYQTICVQMIFQLILKRRIFIHQCIEGIKDTQDLEILLSEIANLLEQSPDTRIDFSLQHAKKCFETGTPKTKVAILRLLGFSGSAKSIPFLARQLCQKSDNQKQVALSLHRILEHTYD